MKTGAIVQARTSSTRFPEKILKKLPYGSDLTVLEHVIRRVKRSRETDDVIIATTTDKEDNEIVHIAEKAGVKYFRGSREDVLERYYLAAKENELDVIVRITSDCPCIDPSIIDLIIKILHEKKADYATNTLKRSFPHGLDAEAFTFMSLENAYFNAKQYPEREHVTLYINRSRPDLFEIANIPAPEGLYGPDIRITLDTEEDYALLCAVFDHLYSKDDFFDAGQIIKLFKQKPWLKLINQKVFQKKIFDTLNEELEETIRILDKQDLKMARDAVRNLLTNSR